MLLNLTDLLLLSSAIWLPLFLLSLLSQFLVRLLGKRVTVIIGIIGVPIHEASHMLACILCNHKIKGFALYKPCLDGTLGYVNHEYRRSWISPLCLLLIGMAPLIGGWLVFGALTAALRPDLAQFFSSYSGNIANIEQAMTFLSMFAGSIFSTGGILKTIIWMIIGFSILLFSVPSRADFNGCKNAVITLIALLAIWFWLFPAFSLQTIEKIIGFLTLLAGPLYVVLLILLPALGLLWIRRVLVPKQEAF
jgi:hypothetical protein